ncbi:MAG TPA: TetR/AcrR family transcriptional regulator [Actinomycetota bacterium]|nr:TetR/AcrR family transcriptional regulator [Actinomycetota bacterium]
MTTPPTKGQQTRARLLAAAEDVFGRRGFHEASIAEITRGAGVAQGSFYLYFPSKLEAFEELIRTRGEQFRTLLKDSAYTGGTHVARERAGFVAFFEWIAQHRWLYRVVRQAEFVNPELREQWYRGFAAGYAESLRRAMERGELPHADAEVLAWVVMGAADFTAMRWIVWPGDDAVMPDEVFEEFVRLALRTIGAAAGDVELVVRKTPALD